MTFEYRRDGWPLCPQCGEDELMSTERLALVAGVLRQPTPADPMKCLNCQWEGTVPVQETSRP